LIASKKFWVIVCGRVAAQALLDPLDNTPQIHLLGPGSTRESFFLKVAERATIHSESFRRSSLL